MGAPKGQAECGGDKGGPATRTGRGRGRQAGAYCTDSAISISLAPFGTFSEKVL